jgi:hypothetical protein
MGHGPTTSGGFGGFGAGGPNSYGPTNNPGLTHMSDQGFQSSQYGRNTAQNAIDEHRPDDTASPATKSKKGKRSSHSTLKGSNRHQTSTTTTTSSRRTSAPSVSPSISPPYGPTNNPGLDHMSDQGLQSSEFGRNTAQNAIDTHRPGASAGATATATTQTISAPAVSPSISPPYGPTNNPGLDHMSDQGLQSSQFGRDTAQNAIDAHRPGASPTASP